ncbi:hypothetical protein Y1Q_0001598 [Alligator mississippiensis]|uniref:Uncharacterized protein n=1 Tax=Alligator mississippiensis TaxID=8496 RepID=A0A151MAC6_ALLMI|nr:hypothetical protein Y1Q_0001598 [Alligator mississippiensis]
MGLGVNEPVDGSLYAFWYATMHLTLAYAHNVDMLNGYCYQQLAASEIRHRTQELEEDVAEPEAALLHVSNDAALLKSLQSLKKCLQKLAEGAARGAWLRALCQELAEADAPTSCFFSLERRRAVAKALDHLKTPEGQLLTDLGKVLGHAVAFCQDLFAADPICPQATQQLHKDLPHLSTSHVKALEHKLSLAELEAAVGGLTFGRALGLDGLPMEFYKAFWPLLGPSLLHVFCESLANGTLLTSCHQAVLTLLPKKGDLGCLKKILKKIRL